MDVFADQERARAASRRLVAVFGIGVLLTAAATGAVLGGMCAIAASHGITMDPWRIGSWSAAIALAGMLAWSWLKWRELASGGEAVALALGGSRILGQEGDAERRLLNVVAEMSIASGVPAPQVFVLRQEAGINAFAAGHGPADAAVAVSAGALATLDRDELQAVVAHEFSHLLNGDMALNLRLLAMLHGIQAVALAGEELIRLGRQGDSGGSRWSRNRRNPGLPLILAGAGLWLVGSIGHLAGRIIRAGVSRSREFLADAAAAQFTRNPQALASALARVARQGAAIHHARAGEFAHFYLCDGLERRWAGWFATHPPIAERIQRLGGDPLERRLADPVAQALAQPEGTPAGARPWVAAMPARLDPARLVPAQELAAGLPMALLEAGRDLHDARAVATALVLEAEAPRRMAQRDALERLADDPLRRALRRLQPLVDTLPAGGHLALAGLVIPVLRELPPARRADLRDLLRQTVQAASPRATLAVLARHRRLELALRPRTAQGPAQPVEAMLASCAVLLSAFAHADGTAQDPRAAFAAAVDGLLGPGGSLPLAEPERLGGLALDAALDRLTRLDGPGRQRLMAACARAVAADGRITPREREWLHLAADTLGLPVPA